MDGAAFHLQILVRGNRRQDRAARRNTKVDVSMKASDAWRAMGAAAMLSRAAALCQLAVVAASHGGRTGHFVPRGVPHWLKAARVSTAAIRPAL
jgi:hypothetical protein